MNKHLVCLFIGLSAVVGCASHRGGGSAHPALAPLPANCFAQQWFNDLHMGKDNADQMYLRDDTLFIYSQGNQVYALGGHGGDLRYIAHPEVTAATLHPPLSIGEFVLYPSGSNLELTTAGGRPLRTITLDKPTSSGGAVTGGTLYIGMDHTAGTGVFSSIDLNKPYHNVNWEVLTNGAVSGAPVVFNKIVYCGAADGKIYAVDEKRENFWRLPGGSNTFNTQGQFVSDLKVDDYGLYASNTDSKLYCIDRTNGRMKWQYYSGQSLSTAPIVFTGLVYQFVPGSGIVAIDKANGTFNRQPKWTVKDARRVLSEDVDNVYLGSREGRILAVDKKTGQQLFASKSQWDLFATNMSDSTIYAMTKDGKLTAVRPVLREGEVGTIVMDLRPEPLAFAR